MSAHPEILLSVDTHRLRRPVWAPSGVRPTPDQRPGVGVSRRRLSGTSFGHGGGRRESAQGSPAGDLGRQGDDRQASNT
jgi:hypothetical protein